MSWTALIPLKAQDARKSRLAGVMSHAQRQALSEELYQRVLACIEAAGLFDTVLTLSPACVRPPTRRWLQRAPALNAELEQVRGSLAGPLLVVNADLPLLEPQDLRALARTALRSGSAIAPDRHGTGTNAVALLPGAPFMFAFGPGSFGAHLRSAPHAGVVGRIGLAFDLDTPQDLAELHGRGSLGPVLSDAALTEWSYAE